MNPSDASLDSLAELSAILGRLDNRQRLCFKQALVEQAIRDMTLVLPSAQQESGHKCGIAAASHWLANPTEATAKEVGVFAAGECIDGGVRHFDYPELFLGPAWVAAADNAEAAAHCSRRTTVDVFSYRRMRGGMSQGEDSKSAATIEHKALLLQLTIAGKLLEGKLPKPSSSEQSACQELGE